MTYIGLLRAVNLGPHNRVAMADLRALVAALGIDNPRTILQSGNVVFEGTAKAASRLEAALESASAKALGTNVEFFVRSASEWTDIVAANPFRKEAKTAPGFLVLLCLKQAASATAVAALQKAIKGREVVRGGGREVYIVYPDGQGRSKLTPATIEKHLGCRCTARNWNTVLKLAEMAGGTPVGA